MSAAVVHHIDFSVNLENHASLPEALVLKIIASARAAGQSLSLPYAGRVSPIEAWQLFSSGAETCSEKFDHSKSEIERYVVKAKTKLFASVLNLRLSATEDLVGHNITKI